MNEKELIDKLMAEHTKHLDKRRAHYLAEEKKVFRQLTLGMLTVVIILGIIAIMA